MRKKSLLYLRNASRILIDITGDWCQLCQRQNIIIITRPQPQKPIFQFLKTAFSIQKDNEDSLERSNNILSHSLTMTCQAKNCLHLWYFSLFYIRLQTAHGCAIFNQKDLYWQSIKYLQSKFLTLLLPGRILCPFLCWFFS